MTLTILSFASLGLAWQGRYALPLAVGFPALAGLALSRADRVPSKKYLPLLVVACALAQTISVVHVAWVEAGTGLSPTFADIGLPGAIGLIGTIALVGSLLPLLLGRQVEPLVDLPRSRPGSRSEPAGAADAEPATSRAH